MDEPAFGQIGDPGSDYLAASSPDEVVSYLKLIRHDQNIRHGLIFSGRQKARLYNRDTITERWVDLILGPICSRYAQWQRHRRRERLRSMAYQLADRARVTASDVARLRNSLLSSLSKRH